LAKEKLWLPVSAGRKAGHRQVSLSREAERVIGQPSEETFDVGYGKNVYIPGASRLEGHQLSELLHKEREVAEQEANAFAKRQVTHPVSREQVDDLKGAMKSISDWRRKRRASK
tara:strand:- start:1901 stop:2242 length:342 start_codon:yes stop_codon:yes gene_type:complete